ncbi:hypothetical protein AMECASPLE_001782 [Ameca splendens]|uniref:Uncharacterized protein n=1 Tax=Ameca splendens TaxID=208324 RepID=A0ABV0YK42_9TELE
MDQSFAPVLGRMKNICLISDICIERRLIKREEKSYLSCAETNVSIIIEIPQLLTLCPRRWRLPITPDRFCGVCLALEREKSQEEYYSSYKNAGLWRALCFFFFF